MTEDPQKLGNNDEHDLTNPQVFFPLAVAGGLGGVCNTGIQYVIPMEAKGDLLPNHNLPVLVELSIYLIFSVVIGAILGPVVAMFSIGLPNTKNWNRILIMSVVFGAFLTVTIQIARSSIFASRQIQHLERQKQDLVERIPDKITESIAGETKTLAIPENILIKAETLFNEAKDINTPQKRGEIILQLENLDKQVKYSDNAGSRERLDTINRLSKTIDSYVEKLQKNTIMNNEATTP